MGGGGASKVLHAAKTASTFKTIGGDSLLVSFKLSKILNLFSQVQN